MLHIIIVLAAVISVQVTYCFYFTDEKLKFKKASRRVYKMKGVTKVIATAPTKMNMPGADSTLSPKERILGREATRGMKQKSKRRQNVYHPAATPRGQTYKTTTRSRHKGRNPIAMRRMAEKLKAEMFINLTTEPKSSQRHTTKRTKKPALKKKPQPKKASKPKKTSQSKTIPHSKQKTQRGKGVRKNNKTARRSNNKASVKNSKTIPATNKMIPQTAPIDKSAATLKTTKSIQPNTTLSIVLTSHKQTTKMASTISSQTLISTSPEPIVTKQQLKQITSIAKTVMDKMLNQQILTAPVKSKDGKVNKRSLVKKYNGPRNKKLTQIHANKTKSKHVKTIPKKLQKRSKINLNKSNKVNKRRKRDINIYTTTDKALDKATIVEFGEYKNVERSIIANMYKCVQDFRTRNLIDIGTMDPYPCRHL